MTKLWWRTLICFRKVAERMARPGLYDEFVKLGLLERGKAVAQGPGTDEQKAESIALLVRDAGSTYHVTDRSVFFFRHRLDPQGEPIGQTGSEPIKRMSPGLALPSRQSLKNEVEVVTFLRRLARCEGMLKHLEEEIEWLRAEAIRLDSKLGL